MIPSVFWQSRCPQEQKEDGFGLALEAQLLDEQDGSVRGMGTESTPILSLTISLFTIKVGKMGFLSPGHGASTDAQLLSRCLKMLFKRRPVRGTQGAHQLGIQEADQKLR